MEDPPGHQRGLPGHHLHLLRGSTPGGFPVPEHCLEPEDPEDLLANNPYEPGAKSTEELGEMLPWDLTPEDMGDDLEEAA